MHLSILLAIACSVAAVEPATYQWRSLPVGVGGYPLDIVPHPTRPGELWVNSDMTGPFVRRRPDADFVDVQRTNPQMSLGSVIDSVSGLAIHPQRPDTVWADVRGPGLMRSTDSGRTFQAVHPVQSFVKQEGPTIALEPDDPDAIWRGTDDDGLFVSRRGGDSGTWSKVVVAPQAAAGAAHYVVATRGRIFVAVGGIGVHASTDHGATWTRLSDDGPVANPAKVRQLAVDADGVLYVCQGDRALRWRAGDGWRDITPAGATAKLRAIAVHPRLPGRIILAQDGYAVHVSCDGGTTWRGPLSDERRGGTVATTGRAGWFGKPFAAAVSRMAWDPHQDGRVWVADAYMLWQCDDIGAAAPVFSAQWHGLENTVATSLTPSPRADGIGTELMATFADIRGLRFASIDEAPPLQLAEPIQGKDGRYGNDMSGMATCEQHPLRWYAAINKHWKGPAFFMRSDDGGITWRWLPHPLPKEENHGGPKLAVSATDPDVVVYVPGRRLPVQRSTDGGATWQGVAGLPPLHGGDRNFNFDQLVAADTVEGQTFYAFSATGGGGLFISRDAGATWKAGGSLPRRDGDANLYPIQLVAKPGQAGALAISIGKEGIFRSTDYGATFTRLDRFTGGEACGVAYGAPAPGSSVPALYVQAFLPDDARRGVFRSLDDGATWQRLDDATYLSDQPTVFTASRQVFGRVYLADQGMGLIVGEPVR